MYIQLNIAYFVFLHLKKMLIRCVDLSNPLQWNGIWNGCINLYTSEYFYRETIAQYIRNILGRQDFKQQKLSYILPMTNVNGPRFCSHDNEICKSCNFNRKLVHVSRKYTHTTSLILTLWIFLIITAILYGIVIDEITNNNFNFQQNSNFRNTVILMYYTQYFFHGWAPSSPITVLLDF